MLYTDLRHKTLILRADRPDRFEKKAKRHELLPPYLGIAHRDHVPLVEQWLGRVTVIEQVAEWVIWKEALDESV